MKTGERKIEHYYGDITRKLLIAAGVLMLIATPFFKEYLPQPIITTILSIVLIAFIAGFTSPSQKHVAVANLVVSSFALMAFEAYAIYMYSGDRDINRLFFIVSQTLALIFFVDVYYSSKTVRGMFLNSARESDEIAEVLLKHGKNRGDMRDIFWEIMAGGATEETAAHIITDSKKLDRYLFLRQNGLGNTGAVESVKREIGRAI